MSDVAFAGKVLGSQLEQLGEALVPRLGLLNVWTAALFGGALLLDLAMRRRVRASLRIALYAPVFARLVVPLDWTLPVSGGSKLSAFMAPLHLSAAPTDLPRWHAPSYKAAFVVTYAFVALVLALRVIVQHLRLRADLAAAKPAPTTGHDAPCAVVEHETLGPMAAGLLVPRIVVPRRLFEEEAKGALSWVLRHEGAHVRRHDGWLAAAMDLVLVVAWPVLPSWLAAARVRQLIELACDEAALEGANAEERRAYGHVLLDAAERDARTVMPLGSALSFGSALRGRIDAIVSMRPWSSRSQKAALAAAPVMLFAACSGAAVPASSGSGGDNYGYAFETDPSSASPTDAGGATGPNGRLAPEVIQANVRAHFDVFRRCYETGLLRDPKLAGKVAVAYTIGEDGVTKRANDDGSTLADPAVVSCIVAEFKTISYPHAAGRGEVTVVYPIEFSP